MTGQEFAQETRRAADAVRRLPRALHDALPRITEEEVAAPLAERVRSAGGNTYARRVSATATVQLTPHPTLVIGGARQILSGGATGSDIAPGTEFGGGQRVGTVSASRARSHRRRTTRQFVRQQSPFAVRTVERSLDWAFQRFVDAVEILADRQVPRG